MFNRIELTLRRSIPLALILATGWTCLAAALLAASLQISAWLVLTLLPVAWLAVSSVRHLALLRAPGAVTRLRVDGDQLQAVLANGQIQTVTANGNSRLYGPMALLKLSAPAAMLREYTVILVALPLCQNTDPDAFRRLRVWLRFSRGGHPTASDTMV